MGEQVAAQQSARGLVEEHARLPAVWHVRRVDVEDAVPPEFDDLTVGQRQRGAVGEIVQRHHAPEPAVGDLSLRRRGKEQVHRTTLVSLHVTERDPAERVEWQHRCYRFRHEREHRPRAGVEQQWLIVIDEELVEREAGGADLGNEGRESVDAIGDLVDSGLHGVSFAIVVRGGG